MDKINVKIRSILCTLEREEDHYRRRFVGESGERRRERVKTEGKMMMTEASEATWMRMGVLAWSYRPFGCRSYRWYDPV